MGFHGQCLGQERCPVAGQEVSALHLHSQAVHFQLLPQEGLLIKVVPPDEDERRAMAQAFGCGAIAYLAQCAVGSIHLPAQAA